jgi:triacylglycerol esterase/lipase EstA (alpha/beta hydrolase family)
MQRRHSIRHLAWRGGVAMVSDGLMLSGLYPLGVHAWRAARGDRPTNALRIALAEWGMALIVSALRPAGFWPLPGATNRGPRPIVMLHGYAMNRANFVVLARRLAAAGLGPIYGFEYWTLGRTSRAARQLAEFVAQVCKSTGASEVDLIGHSMGGVVARYYVAFAGGDDAVAHLVTLGSPHLGSELSAYGIGHARRELVAGSQLLDRLAAAPAPARTKVTAIWSRADALVPGSTQRPLPGAETVMFDTVGHLGLLASTAVVSEIVARLKN